MKNSLEKIKKEVEEINSFLKIANVEYSKLSDGAKDKLIRMFNNLTKTNDSL